MGHWITLTHTFMHSAHSYSTSKGNLRLVTQSSLNKYWYFKDGFNWIATMPVSVWLQTPFMHLIYIVYIRISFDTKWYGDGASWLYYLRVLLIGSLHRPYEAQFLKEKWSECRAETGVVKRENSMHYYVVVAGRILEIKKISKNLLQRKTASGSIAFTGFLWFFLS